MTGKFGFEDVTRICEALDISVEPSAILEELQNIDGLTLENKVSKKTGKQRRYILGLALTDKAKDLLEQADE
jgi:hypothetical protein